MSNYDNETIEEFIVEANELLDSAEAELLSAEKGKSTNFYDSAFRAFHSIKGGAGMLGLESLQSHMHKLENQWTTLKGQTKLEKNDSEYFLAAIDAGRKILSGEKVEFDYSTRSQNSNIFEKPTSPHTLAQSVTQPNMQNSEKGRSGNEAKRCHIAAIDDEPIVLDIVKDTLSDEGFSVSTYDTPESFLASIKTKAPDVIITDYKMPTMSGLDILKAVKENHPDIPVIILTGHITKDIFIESLKDGGFYRAIEKPFKDVNLIQDCWAAYRFHEVKKMIRKSINLLVYQFSDLEKFLISNGQDDVAKVISNELKDLLKKIVHLIKLFKLNFKFYTLS